MPKFPSLFWRMFQNLHLYEPNGPFRSRSRCIPQHFVVRQSRPHPKHRAGPETRTGSMHRAGLPSALSAFSPTRHCLSPGRITKNRRIFGNRFIARRTVFTERRQSHSGCRFFYFFRRIMENRAQLCYNTDITIRKDAII